MRKILAGLISFILLLCGLLPAAVAETAKDDSAAFGVDMVIVLDMTNSMRNPYDTSKGNDVFNYRLDATAMLIGMLDMDRSRVAIVPFAASPMNVIDLQPIGDQASRSALLNSIYSIQVKPKTNIGAALMTANHILDTREDKTNLPAIILMTDGNNDMVSDDGPTGKVADSWRWENGQIVNKGQEVYTTETAIQVTREAVDCAATLGYPIYTVALSQDPDATPDNGISLRAISQGTGLTNGCWFVSKDNSQELPSFFAEVLADKIGSSIQNEARPEGVEGKPGYYQVKIPVLNKSVLETNIIIPTKATKGSVSGIDPKTIQIMDAEGTLQSEYTGVTVLYDKNQSHFALVKIREPRTTGMWTLQFASDKTPDNVKFNILYHYDIQLAAAVSLAGNDQQEFFKNELITIRSNFVDGQGNPSVDEALYTDNSETPDYADWMKMKVSWELYQLNASGIMAAEPVRTGTMTPDAFRYVYDGQIDLRTETLPSGNYHLIVRADGAGLNRKVTVPITLKNHEPEATDYVHSINVNSTALGSENTWTVEGTSGTLPSKAGDIVADKDNDKLSFSIRAEEGVEQAATLELAEDGTISFTTKKEGEGIKAGQALYRLYYDDGDTGKGNIAITLNIRSDVAAMLEKYEPEMTVTGTNAGADNEYLKNTSLTVSVRLKEKNGAGYAGPELVEFLGRRLAITDLKQNEIVVSEAGMELNGDALEFTTDTGNRSAEWEIAVSIDFFDEPVKTTISIPNKAGPEIKKEYVDEGTLILNCDGERVPSFLSGIIGTDTPEDDPARDICTTALFTDSDNDILTISDPEFTNPGTEEAMDLAVISAAMKDAEPESKEKHYLINYSGESTGIFNYSFTANLNVKATDGDQQTKTYTRQIVVVDLFNKMLTYLAILLIAIVTLTILFLIIHQIRKPRFPLLNMTIREEPSLYESGSETLSPVKTPTTANAIGIDSEMAGKHNISMDLLQQISVYPVRSTTSVGVTVKKAVPGHEVMLADVLLKPKKKYIWRLNDELSIRSLSGEGLVAIKLEDRSTDGDQDVASTFGSDDDWSTSTEQQAATAMGRKHSKKVQRAKKQEEDNSFSGGSNDDFDF